MIAAGITIAMQGLFGQVGLDYCKLSDMRGNVMVAREPFVGIMGGFWQIDEQVRAAAVQAAREIGFELAKAGFGLVVYNSDDTSLEPHVVEGFASGLPDGKGKIRVRCSSTQRGEVEFKEQKDRRELFDYRDFTQTDWQAPFFRSLAEDEGVDGVVLMGGAQTVLIAGHIALARRLPILAVDKFGGSARTIWTELAQNDREVASWGRKSPAEFIQEFKAKCVRHIADREALREKEAGLNEALREKEAALKALSNALSSARLKSTLSIIAAVAFIAIVLGGLHGRRAPKHILLSC